MTNSLPATAQKLLKPADASAYLAISPRKLWSIKSTGDLPHIRIGTAVRYSVDDLDDWIERQRQGGHA